MVARNGRKCGKCVGKLCNKFPKILKYSKKILKIDRKFPRLSERVENAKKCVGPSDQMVGIDAEVFSHGCQNLKSPKCSGSNFENLQKKQFPFSEVSHSGQIIKNSNFFQGASLKNFLFWKFPTVVKNEKGSKKSEKIQKNSKNY